MPNIDLDVDVAVLGSGPGGYTAAFRAADLGKRTVLIERYATLGGVCLNVGCIPSKALLHVAKVMNEASELKNSGVTFGEPDIDLKKLRGWVDKVVGTLTGGLSLLAKRRSVQVVHGYGEFVNGDSIHVVGDDNVTTVRFRDAIIAAGSQASALPFLPDDPRIVDSTGALALKSVPERLLIIGGGIIGLELATVYPSLEIAGRAYLRSRTTLRPRGPMVTRTASPIRSTPVRMRSRALAPRSTSLWEIMTWPSG